MEIFRYDKKQNYETNYAHWKPMNRDERHQESLDYYSEKESREVFDRQWGMKYPNGIVRDLQPSDFAPPENDGICDCGKPIAECQDAYVHITQGY